MNIQILLIIFFGVILCKKFEIKIGTFNLNELTKKKIEDQFVTETLLDIFVRFDLLFLQGVTDPVYLRKVVDAMNRETQFGTKDWNYNCSMKVKRPGKKKNKLPYYAYLYNRNKIHIDRLYQFIDDHNKAFENRPPFGAVVLVKKPNFRFFVMGMNAVNNQEMDSIVVWQSKTAKEVMNFLETYERVFLTTSENKDFVFGKKVKIQSDLHEGNNLLDFHDLQFDLFRKRAVLLGDFNADCQYVSQAQMVKIKEYSNRLKLQWQISEDSTVNDTFCAFDRIVVSKNFAKNSVVNGYEIFNFVKEFGFFYDLKAATKVSFNFPVAMKFRFNVLTKAEIVLIALSLILAALVLIIVMILVFCCLSFVCVKNIKTVMKIIKKVICCFVPKIKINLFKRGNRENSAMKHRKSTKELKYSDGSSDKTDSQDSESDSYESKYSEKERRIMKGDYEDSGSSEFDDFFSSINKKKSLRINENEEKEKLDKGLGDIEHLSRKELLKMLRNVKKEKLGLKVENNKLKNKVQKMNIEARENFMDSKENLVRSNDLSRDLKESKKSLKYYKGAYRKVAANLKDKNQAIKELRNVNEKLRGHIQKLTVQLRVVKRNHIRENNPPYRREENESEEREEQENSDVTTEPREENTGFYDDNKSSTESSDSDGFGMNDSLLQKYMKYKYNEDQ